MLKSIFLLVRLNRKETVYCSVFLLMQLHIENNNIILKSISLLESSQTDILSPDFYML